MPRALVRLNRRVANPVMRLVAGWLPSLAIGRHRGRVTGCAYATPVVAFGVGDDLVIGFVGTAEVLRLLPATVRGGFRLLRVRHFLHLTVSAPGGSSS